MGTALWMYRWGVLKPMARRGDSVEWNPVSPANGQRARWRVALAGQVWLGAVGRGSTAGSSGRLAHVGRGDLQGEAGMASPEREVCCGWRALLVLCSAASPRLRLYIVRTDATLCEETPVPERPGEASVEDRAVRRLGKVDFLITLV
ncbi:uncharacterized protein LOC123427019 [Hordeum vulgare subsp. vulgare]|uniref:uncharacterized protein LOC123427019 n=1 Tax=Hordeum vulgare subsp. vulgare TaxID=112509 RepID=UPI001D1A4950|nr:uncharacterized protein LOC123427019 [Hordeum vulgare subsp. vulgare]